MDKTGANPSSNLFHMPFPVPKQCEDMLQDLHQTITQLDSCFHFSWDSELTLMFTSKYLKQAAEAIVHERSQTSNHPGTRLTAEAENALRARERLLNEKEARDQLNAQKLKAEENRLNDLKARLEEETKRNLEEKRGIEQSFAQLIEEKNRVAAQMKKLEERYSEIKGLLAEIEAKKTGFNSENVSEKDLVMRYQDFERIKTEFEKEKEVQITQFLKIEASLKERDANLELKKESLQQLANSLQKLKKELTSHHEKISEQMDSQFTQLQEQEKELKDKKLEMDVTLGKLNQELTEVEDLKKSLESSQRTVDYSQISDSDLQEKVKNLVQREELLHKLSQDLSEKEKQLEERAKYFDSVENLKDELDRVQKLYQDMENDFETREIQVASKSQALDLRERQIAALENSDPSSLLELNNEIKENIKKMQEDESKLLKAQDFVIKEKEELDKSTKMLQGIFQELTIQKKKLMEDQLNLELEKEKFVEVVGKLEEESRNISESEEFVSSKLLELQKKELELEQKELSLLEKEKEMLESQV